MYRFDKKLDLSSLVGENLERICIGRYDTQFHVGTNISIGLESRAILPDEIGVAAAWSGDEGWSSTRYHEILNQEIIAASVKGPHLLEIAFANRWRLQLFDESDEYESMTIWGLNDDDSVVVI